MAFVQNQLSTPDLTKATGLDGLSAKYLRLSAEVIARHVTKVLNMSIKTRKFTDILKKVKVTSCFKKGDKHDKPNYRPISILPVLSKVIEKHVSEHVKSYLDSNKLLYERQSGFRKDHSCETALTAMVDGRITAIDRNEVVGTVFLDFSKAFDLVDHKLLLAKLRHYKFSANTLKWFSSYLKQCCQQISVSGKVSNVQHISSGVPQGSVLGPLLFYSVHQ